MGDFVSTSQGRLGYGIVQGFSPKAVYQKRDVVHFRGSAFAVLRDGVTGIEPVSDGINYQLFVSQGEDGSSNAVWHSGTAVTGTGTGIVAGVPGSAAGDMYLNSDDANVYIATSPDTWDFVRNIEGPQGIDGQDGADGQGVPIGGSAGQVLAKAGTGDFETKWETLLASGIGTTTSGTSVQAALDAISTVIGGRTLQPTLLWSGNWTTGTISIPITTTLMYNMFIFMSEEGYPFIGTRNPNLSVTNITMQGVDVYPNGTLIELHYAYITYGGATWHLSGSMKVIITTGGGISTMPDTAISRIYGLI